jgi:hypothetical protein
MTFKHRFILTLLVTVSVGGSLVGGSLYRAAQDKPDQELPRMSESQIAAEVQKALPKWDENILSAPAGKRWSARIRPDAVLKAVNDSPLKTPAATNARRIVDGERVLRVIPELGEVRYVNNALNWSPDRPKKLVDKETALQIVNKAFEGLGMPRPEFDKPRVDTQGGHDASTTTPADSSTFEMYRLVTVNRRIRDLPVLGSRARVAIAGSGSIQRLRVNWPAFTMREGLRLRQRDVVAREIVSQIMKQDPVSLVGVRGSDLRKFVSAKLAYAPQEMTWSDRRMPADKDTEKLLDENSAPKPDWDDIKKDRPVQFASLSKPVSRTMYVPVLLVTVAAGPTPYQIVIPLAEGR